MNSPDRRDKGNEQLSFTRRLMPSFSSTQSQNALSAEINSTESNCDTEERQIENENRLHRMMRLESDPIDYTGLDLTDERISKSTRNNKAAVNEKYKSVNGHLPSDKKNRARSLLKPFLTLPRLIVENNNHNHNCWSEPESDLFQVRGVDYLVDKKKVYSGPYIFPARGADLILTNEGSDSTTQIALNTSILAGQARAVPTFILNFILPWGILVHYYEIPCLYVSFLRKKYERGETIHDEMLECLAPHERAIIRFFTGDDEHRNSTLKLIPVCITGPWVVKQMVYGKPAIIGKRVPVEYKYYAANPSSGLAECFEADLDIVASVDPVGKKVVQLIRKYMSAVTVDVGVVIEGNKADELPEQMLGCIRLHKLDAMSAPFLN